jgi:cell shape-determining protein MreC
MKTNYLQKSRLRHSRAKLIALIVALFAAGAFAFSLLDSFIISAVSPLWRAEGSVARTFSGALGFFRGRGALIEENRLLKERISSLELSLANNSSIGGEDILAILGRSTEGRGIPAGVLTRPPQSLYDLIVVDAGEKDGVTLGSKVSLPEGPELGTVFHLFPHSAKVRLFSTSGEKTNAVLERHGVPVVLEGTGAGNFRIIVPRDTAVEIGDRVVTASLTSNLLAIIEEVKVEPTDSFKEILARSPANIFSIRIVTVSP